MSMTSASFEDAELRHLRDALRATTAERWQWLQQAMDFGFATARARAAQGRITFGPHGEVLWSPLHEERWTREGRLPDADEVAALLASRNRSAELREARPNTPPRGDAR